MALERADYVVQLSHLYGDQIAHVRHQEGMRALSTNYIIVASVALFGLLVGQKVFGYDWDPFGKQVIVSLICILNYYGIALSFKHHERSHLHARVAEQYRRQISSEFEAAGFVPTEVLRAVAYQENKLLHPITDGWRLHKMWAGFHIIFILMALAVVGLNYVSS